MTFLTPFNIHPTGHCIRANKHLHVSLSPKCLQRLAATQISISLESQCCQIEKNISIRKQVFAADICIKLKHCAYKHDSYLTAATTNIINA